jgi:type IV pilus assembly protein PilA
VRAKVSEVVLAGSACRTSITEIVQSASGSLPTGTGTSLWGCEAGSTTGNNASKYVKTVTVSSAGVVTVTADSTAIPQLGTKNVITLTPAIDAAGTAVSAPGQNIFKWTCGPATGGTGIEVKYLPGSCRG